MQKSRELTPSEQRWLRHLRRAQEQGVTLVDYARSAGVKVGSLYEARHSLARKGVQVREAVAEVSPRKSGEFITVQVEPSAVPVAGEPVCRLRHPGGWIIECADWPVASWVAQIFGGGVHDTP
jgi:hypothetical protein